MKIIRLQAENIKKIIAVDIEPSGAVVKITGKNGQGKSSVLDALWWALGGTKGVQSEPIRRGEEKAKVVLDLGTMTVTRRFTHNGSTLVIENADGSVFRSPQSILDGLLGQLTFDPLEFMRMKPADQFATLRTLTGIDLSALDTRYKNAFEVRTEVNRDAKSLAAQAAAVVVAEDAPDEEVPVQIVAEKLAAAVQVQAVRTAAKATLDAAREAWTKHKADFDGVAPTKAKALEDLDAEYERRKAEIQEASEAEMVRLTDLMAGAELQEKGAVEALQGEAPDLDALRAELAGQEEKNRQARTKLQRKDLAEKQAAKEHEAQTLTDELATIIAEKEKQLGAATFPLPGLSFGDGSVTFNGLPLEQASSAEQLRISMAMAMALNPKLRVLRITDGSLLDSASMKIVEEMCAASDYQAWIEAVDESGKIGIVIEDGQVAAVNA